MEKNNKKDWNALEDWAKEEKEKNKEKYGIDLDKVDTEKQHKAVDRLNTFLGTTGKWILYVLLVMITILIIGAYIVIVYNFVRFDHRLDEIANTVVKVNQVVE